MTGRRKGSVRGVIKIYGTDNIIAMARNGCKLGSNRTVAVETIEIEREFSIILWGNNSPNRALAATLLGFKITHINTVALFLMSHQLIAATDTYRTHDKHNRRTSVPSTVFEPATPGIKRTQNNAVDRVAIGIG